MKLITALIPPERLEATKEELGKARIFRLTVMDVQGVAVGGAESGSGGGVSGGTAAERYGAGGSTSPKARPLVKLLVAVNEDFVEPCIGAVLRAAVMASRFWFLESAMAMVASWQPWRRMRPRMLSVVSKVAGLAKTTNRSGHLVFKLTVRTTS